MKISKSIFLLLTLSIMTIIFCSCSAFDDMTYTDSYRPESATGTNRGEAGSYDRTIPDGTVTGGDTVGNSINRMLGGNAVGEENGMSGTSTRGTRNNVKGSKNTGRVNTNRGNSDGGKKTSDSATSINGINSRNAGGSGNPNYTK